MSTPQPSLVPLAGHRLFTITADDHRGQIWVVSVIFGIFSVLVLCLRGFIGRGNLGHDDWSAAAATVSCVCLTLFCVIADRIQLLGLGQLVSLLAAASNGLGHNSGGTLGARVGRVRSAGAPFSSGNGSAEASNPLQLTMASEAILILGLAFAKVSILLLIRRIVSAKSAFCDTLLGLSVLWGLASVLAITVNCSPSHMVGINGFCEHQVSHPHPNGLSFADDPCSYSAGNSSRYSTQ